MKNFCTEVRLQHLHVLGIKIRKHGRGLQETIERLVAPDMASGAGDR